MACKSIWSTLKCISLLRECKLQDGKAEYETHSIAAKVIFISALKVHVHVIEDIVLMIVLKSKLKDKLHA
jgi:hypothetical protein